MRERNVLHDEINYMEFALFLNELNRYKGKNIRMYRQSIGNYVENGLQSINYLLCEHELFENQEFKYLYFGNEFCEYRIPKPNQVQKFLEICEKEELIPVLVTPVVTDFGLERIEDCLKYLNSYNGKLSIVVNDYGVMELLKKNNNNKFEIIAGRVLDKLSHESRASNDDLYEYYDEEGLKYAMTPGILSKSHRKVLNKYDVVRYEFDFPKVGIAPSIKTRLSLYWPYSYETTGRVCLFQSFDKVGNEKFLVGSHCKINCKNIIVERVTASNKTNDKYYLFQVGNTMFYLNETIDLNQISTIFDRLIIQIF